MVSLSPSAMTPQQALQGAIGVPLGLIPVGRIVWVDSTASNAIDAPLLGVGEFDRPFATINYAVTRCKAGRGDLIIVKRGHYESGFGQVSWDCDGLTIYGEGEPAGDATNRGGRPLIEMTGGDAIELQGDAMHVHNLEFMADGFGSSTYMVNLDAPGCVMTGCVMRPYQGGDSVESTVRITQSDCVVAACLFTQTAQSGAASAMIQVTGGDRPVLVLNRFEAQTAAALFDFSAAAKDVSILRNQVGSHVTSLGVMLGGSAIANVEGICAYNALYHENNITGINTLMGNVGKMAAYENYLMNQDGESGDRTPKTVSA
jgi:hypothetical protein